MSLVCLFVRALSIPLLDGQIYGQIRKKLVDALGGRFKEIIIGGAAMNPEVEEFFHRIKFLRVFSDHEYTHRNRESPQ